MKCLEVCIIKHNVFQQQQARNSVNKLPYLIALNASVCTVSNTCNSENVQSCRKIG